MSPSNEITVNKPCQTHCQGLCVWLRGPDLNQRPSGYEPDELPDCSTPQLQLSGLIPQPRPRIIGMSTDGVKGSVWFSLQSPAQRALTTTALTEHPKPGRE